jgi:hypothetical protein
MANNTKPATQTQQSKAETSSNRKPIHEIRLGAIKACVWQNDTQNGVRYNVTFGRLYKDNDGDWKTADSFGRDDLLLLAKVADLTHSFVFQKQREQD